MDPSKGALKGILKGSRDSIPGEPLNEGILPKTSFLSLLYIPS